MSVVTLERAVGGPVIFRGESVLLVRAVDKAPRKELEGGDFAKVVFKDLRAEAIVKGKPVDIAKKVFAE